MTFKTLFSILFTASLILTSCKEKVKNTENTNVEAVTNETPKENEIDERPAEITETAPHKYICYTDDADESKRIWIAFDEDEMAQKIKYEVQQETIKLKHNKEEYSEGGAHPTVTNSYDEIYNGEVNGTYKLIHSGVWDYVEYTRGKDDKVFKYTIDHDQDPYGDKPCF